MTTNGQECAQIGADILAKNGSAVDAAIAALLCEGVASLHRYIVYLRHAFTHFQCLSCKTCFAFQRDLTNFIQFLRLKCTYILRIFLYFTLKHGTGWRISYDNMGRKN